jgi:two-component system cell cycle sensor histidine kinase/response regulator CckA
MGLGPCMKDETDRIHGSAEQPGNVLSEVAPYPFTFLKPLPAVNYVAALDEARSKLYISPQIEEMLGFPPTEWLNDPGLWCRQIHPQDRERVITELHRDHENGKALRSEYRMLSRDGRVVWVREETVLVRDELGQPCFIEGVLMDISDLQRVEKVSQTSAAKFRAIFERVAIGIAVIDNEGRIIESNPSLEEMLGYSADELRNRFFNEFAHPDDAMADRSLYEDLWEGKRHHYQIEKRYIRRDDELVWGRLNVSLVHGNGSESQFAIFMVEDITEQKRLETQFLHSQKMETIGRLAGGIAHDFNNILMVIKGYSQLSLAEMKKNDPLKPNIEEIRKATERAVDLTRQLLAFSRRQIMDMKVLDLNNVVRDLEKMLRRIIGEDIELVTALADEVGSVKVDPGQIEQVLLNLAVNARDAMPSGGRLTLETSNVELDEEYCRIHISVKPGPYVMLSISDTGCGMLPDVKERIFEPFFTTKEKGNGTGLGLSTVYGIVKQSGGNIWVYSEPGQGTTFKIYLPRVEKVAETHVPRDDAGHLARGNETVLVVEDDPSLRDLIARVLRGLGYAVHEAVNGNDAVQMVHEGNRKKIDLLVTDVVMPRMGGRELVEKIKTVQPEMKVLYISGYTEGSITNHVVFDQEDTFLQKPFSLKDLTKKVREVLDR